MSFFKTASKIVSLVPKHTSDLFEFHIKMSKIIDDDRYIAPELKPTTSWTKLQQLCDQYLKQYYLDGYEWAICVKGVLSKA